MVAFVVSGCLRAKNMVIDFIYCRKVVMRRSHIYSWLVRQVKKLREVSEIVAGPKWKNFLRKIGAYLNDNKRTDFQYDSFNYTLNFDDGNLNDEDYGVNLGFSSRFAPPVVLHDKPARKST